jgi:thioredoxin 1
MSTFQEIINGEKPVLVDFFATWCGPCKAMAPGLATFAETHTDKIKVLKVDIDRNPQAAQAFQVTAVPTLILFHKGQVVWRQAGAMNPVQLQNALKNWL